MSGLCGVGLFSASSCHLNYLPPHFAACCCEPVFHLGPALQSLAPPSSLLILWQCQQAETKHSHVCAVLIISLPPCASKSLLQTSNNKVTRLETAPASHSAADLGH